MQLFFKVLYIVFSSLFFFGCGNGGKAESIAVVSIEKKSEINQEKEEQWLRLKEKGKEALKFCEENKYNTDYCLLVDMAIHSGKNRLFVWDFKKDTISLQGLCAHGMGRGSTEEKPVFSNENGSYCTSLGKYKLGARAYSQWGIHVHYKMHGLEKTNNNAYSRIVVLHSYDPMSDTEIYPQHLPMGWSLGCPVISNDMMKSLDKLLQQQKKPTLLWIYN